MSNIKNISAENCYSTIKENKDAYLVDVRTPYEWETFGRVDEDSFDAQYIELTLINEEGIENINFLSQFNSNGISKNSEIYFICKSGARSMHAALILESNGYQNLYNVEDGFVMGWLPKGLPSVKY